MSLSTLAGSRPRRFGPLLPNSCGDGDPPAARAVLVGRSPDLLFGHPPRAAVDLPFQPLNPALVISLDGEDNALTAPTCKEFQKFCDVRHLAADQSVRDTSEFGFQ